MAIVATDFMKCYKWIFKTPLFELAKYIKEIDKSLKNNCKIRSNAKTRFQLLGLIKEQVKVLIPIGPSEKHIESRDIVDKIVQEIVKNNYLSEKIKQISYDLGSFTLNSVTRSSLFTLLGKKLQVCEADHLKKEAIKIPHITIESNKIQVGWLVLDKFEGVNWLEHFFLELVQEKLEKCNFFLLPSKKDLIDVMIMLSIRLANVATLCIDKYEASDKIWYDSKYSWYCTSYIKTKEETEVGEPQPFLSIEKDLIGAKEFLI